MEFLNKNFPETKQSYAQVTAQQVPQKTSTYPPPADHSYSPQNVSKVQNKPSSKSDPKQLQLGRINAPCQVVKFGFPSDAGKKTTSVQLVVMDPETLRELADLEDQVLTESPALRLNSSVIRTATSEDGTPYPVIRCKFTKRDENFSVLNNSWVDNGGTNLSSLKYGDLVLGQGRCLPWCRNGEVGITIYVNYVASCGYTIDPIGKPIYNPPAWQ